MTKRPHGRLASCQAAIFALIALILGFSFSFAVGRFEVRRALVVSETDAITTAYLRAGFLTPAKSAFSHHTRRLCKSAAGRL
jgi:hypothetical protein